jgi:hypothetical protein
MQKTLLLAFLALISKHSVAETFHLGPLVLGMTNLQVIKHMPISNCREDRNTILCDSELHVAGARRAVSLQFRGSNKTLISAEVTVMDWASNDERIPSLMEELRFQPCPQTMQGETWLQQPAVCFSPPDQMRTVNWNPGALPRRWSRGRGGVARHLIFRIERHPGYYRIFEEKKRALERTRRTDHSMKQFERGI